MIASRGVSDLLASCERIASPSTAHEGAAETGQSARAARDAGADLIQVLLSKSRTMLLGGFPVESHPAVFLFTVGSPFGQQASSSATGPICHVSPAPVNALLQPGDGVLHR